ncbi:hypothetical protein [Arenimonas daejeonensis]|uniref:hypothetical protein n=1 Tax=Arenimonas daejeonensis TaxID=370777 RepID=UPI0011BF2465|nr:hypothetical protein [Arenimonas daejeonensis]
MDDKKLRLLAFALGSLITLAMLLLESRPWSRFGIFTSEIHYTISYAFLHDFAALFDRPPYSFPALYRASLFLWLCCLGVGVTVSWRLRGVVARHLNKAFEAV